MNSNEDALKAITLKHDLTHPFSILERIHRWFGKEDLSASSIRLELIEEGVVPQFHHILPVLDDTMFERMRDLE